LAGLLWGIIVVLLVIWLLGQFVWHLGLIIHVLIVIAVVLFVLWLLGFLLHFGGGIIHLLIVIAIILVIYNLMTGRGARV
jgi:hypothetical protein